MPKTFDVTSPYDLEKISTLEFHSEEDVERALDLAQKTFARGPLPLPERIDILKKSVALFQSRREELALQATREGGKPLVDSLVEVDRGIQGVETAIQSIFELKGAEVPMGITPSSLHRRAFSIRQPIGPVGAISAFNHPFNLIIHQVIPAVITGCPVLVKPALTTPLSCGTIVNTLYEAGLPRAWCQLLHLEDSLAERLVTDQRLGFFSFIGSARVGWMLKSKLAPGVRCALEHGGAAPVLIEPDADIESMVPLLVKGGYYHGGQVCVSVQRVFAQEKIFDQVAQALVEKICQLRLGDPRLKDTQVGPLILPRENKRVESWVQEARQEGAQLLTGGNKASETCFQPTLLTHTRETSKVSTQEIFGPVICLNPYKSLDQGIQRANSLDTSFQSAIFTKNIDAAFHCIEKLKAATVLVNDHTAFRVDWMPFGGHKTSGLGVGGIPHSMRDLCEEKLIVFHSPSL